jgi:hypothetical protein
LQAANATFCPAANFPSTRAAKGRIDDPHPDGGVPSVDVEAAAMATRPQPTGKLGQSDLKQRRISATAHLFGLV